MKVVKLVGAFVTFLLFVFLTPGAVCGGKS